MKIVVTWDRFRFCNESTGVVCLHYESTEAFFLDFDAIIRKYAEDCRTARTAIIAWNEQWRKLSRSPEKNKDLLEKLGKSPKLPPSYISIGGNEFDLEDFVEFIPETLEHNYSMPDVYTLEEWFDSNV